MSRFTSYSPEETQEIAFKLMKKYMPKLRDHCVIFALQGELGAGKTQFAKGVGKALGIKENIVSPTFVLVKEYEFKLKIKSEKGKTTSKKLQITKDHFANPYSLNSGPCLYHIDTWRMQSGEELTDLGFNDMVKQRNVVVVEWVEKVKKIIERVSKKPNVLIQWIDISGEGEEREIEIL